MKTRRQLMGATCLLVATTACSGSARDSTANTTADSVVEQADATTISQESGSASAPADAPATTKPAAGPTTAETLPATTAATTIAPTTTVPTTTLPPIETIEVPVYLIDDSIPADLTCEQAIRGFDVTFTDSMDERTVVEARYKSAFPAPDGFNTTCQEVLADDRPALFYRALLDVPVADTYAAVEVRYPYADGEGADRDVLAYESLTADQAQVGLYIESDEFGTQIVFDPSDYPGFPDFPAN